MSTFQSDGAANQSSLNETFSDIPLSMSDASGLSCDLYGSSATWEIPGGDNGQQWNEGPMDLKGMNVGWKGEPLNSLKIPRSPLPPLRASAEHKIFFNYGISSVSYSTPYPDNYVDEWSDEFVRLPCSPQSVYPVYKKGKKTLVSRWSLIEESLRNPIRSVSDFAEAVLSYNARFRTVWNFNVLKNIVMEQLLPDGNEQMFFTTTLPAICALALNLPIYITQPIPLMRRGSPMSLTFSQLQIASILANAFFCTYPRRNSRAAHSEFCTFPFINFSSLLSAPQCNPSSPSGLSALLRKREKLRCLLHYFHRVTQSAPSGTITYTRRCLGDRVPLWSESLRSFDQLRVHINCTDTIEQAGSCAIQVDFANRYLGGGVLRTGCVQEEITFVLRPELLASCLFTERLAEDETVIIEGSECYSVSTGYADNFQWAGDYRQNEQSAKRDEWGRWDVTIVAMDATHFTAAANQYLPALIARELNKAYCGFADDLAFGRKLPAVVATGNWGCGAFGGNVELKGLIQMMACLQAGKAMAYFTFHDQALCNRLYEMYEFLSSNKITISALWNVLTTLDSCVGSEPHTLYDYIKHRLTPSQ